MEHHINAVEKLLSKQSSKIKKEDPTVFYTNLTKFMHNLILYALLFYMSSVRPESSTLYHEEIVQNKLIQSNRMHPCHGLFMKIHN